MAEIITTENLENWKQELYSCESIYQAFNFFDQHKFKKSQLLEIAEYLGVAVNEYSDEVEITRKIVYSTVAEKLKDDPIRKRNIAKFRKDTHEETDEDIAILNQKFLCDKVRQLREKKYTQSELAKILNVSAGTINNWETGEREPTSTNLRKLAAVLEIPVSNLFGIPDVVQNENETISPNFEPAKPVKFVPCKHCGKPTLEGNKFCHACTWDAKWAKHILNSPELERRRKRSHSTKILSIDRDKGEAIFKSSRNTQTYTTTLKNCTCKDFALGHDAWPCKHILRLAEELGLFKSEHFAPDEDDYTMHDISQLKFDYTEDEDFIECPVVEDDNLYSIPSQPVQKKSSYPQEKITQVERQNLPEQLQNASEELIEKYVTILHFIIRGREIRIRRLQAEIDDINTSQSKRERAQNKLNALKEFTSESRTIKQYKYSNEQDELLTRLLEMGLIEIPVQNTCKTMDIRLPFAMTLDNAENILLAFKNIYPVLFRGTVGDNPQKILQEIINTRRRSEKIIRAYNAKGTPNWAFHVPECFNAALDIKLITRTKNLVDYTVWTQGINFAFDTGDMLYHDYDSYKKGTPAIQVITGIKAQGTTPENLSMGADRESLSTEENNMMLDKYYPGKVVYNDFEAGGIKTTTQLEFVKMLIGK